MGEVHPLPASSHEDDPAVHPAFAANEAANVSFIDAASCALCGVRLTASMLCYHVVSPQRCDTRITVCHLCRKAALGEGYRPA
ncbi:MAG TPA: hypothetical protein VFH61_17190 [Thermoleophilia bacterium]|nr:hypothetical protein [Thermoleophilia bacterium]